MDDLVVSGTVKIPLTPEVRRERKEQGLCPAHGLPLNQGLRVHGVPVCDECWDEEHDYDSAQCSTMILCFPLECAGD